MASGLLCFSGIMGELISRVSIWAGFEGKGSARFSTFDSFPIYGAAVAIFCAFLQLAKRNIQSSKMKRLILFFSCSSFSAYLIHEHPSVRKVLWSAIKLFQYEGVDLLGLLIVSVVVIFCSCIVVDKITWSNVKKFVIIGRLEHLDNKIQNLLFVLEKKYFK